jgi:hypothetical protein
MGPFPDIAMQAPEITAIRDLEFKISKGRDGRGKRRFIPSNGFIREGDQMLIKTILKEFFVRLSYGRTFTLRTFDQEIKRILAQFIEFVIFNVIEIGLFEPLQTAVGC